MKSIFFTFTAWLITQTAIAAPETLTCNIRQSSYTCLVCNCYHESRGEAFDGQVAVAKTVLGRKENKDFPSTVCGVIFQRSQFSWTGDRYPDNISAREPDDKKALNSCRAAVDLAMNEGPNGILYFHNPNVTPAWRNRFDTCGKIDNHVFLAPKGTRPRQNCPSSLGANRSTPGNQQQRSRPSSGGTAR